jgi:predicted Zn-dependent peptidase
MPCDPLIVSEGEFKALETRLENAEKFITTHLDKFLKLFHSLKEKEYAAYSVRIYDKNELPEYMDMEMDIVQISKKDRDLLEEWKKIIHEAEKTMYEC